MRLRLSLRYIGPSDNTRMISIRPSCITRKTSGNSPQCGPSYLWLACIQPLPAFFWWHTTLDHPDIPLSRMREMRLKWETTILHSMRWTITTSTKPPCLPTSTTLWHPCLLGTERFSYTPFLHISYWERFKGSLPGRLSGCWSQPYMIRHSLKLPPGYPLFIRWSLPCTILPTRTPSRWKIYRRSPDHFFMLLFSILFSIPHFINKYLHFNSSKFLSWNFINPSCFILYIPTIYILFLFVFVTFVIKTKWRMYSYA